MTDRDFEQLSERVTEKPVPMFRRVVRLISGPVEKIAQGYRMGMEQAREREGLREIQRNKEAAD